MSIQLAISYPVPMETPEAWETFKPFAQRFCDTWRQHPPCCECTLYAVLNKGTENDALKEMFKDLPVQFVRYDGDGCDLGGHQWLAHQLHDEFLVCMTTRMYFHRRGWGYKLQQARALRGPGLYGMSHSYEGGKLHLCTRGHSLDARDLRSYQHTISSRDQGVFFECGDGCLMEFMERLGRKSFLVTWKGTYGKQNWEHIPNRFRVGDQSSVLCWDKHTDAYRDADEHEKARLASIAQPPIVIETVSNAA